MPFAPQDFRNLALLRRESWFPVVGVVEPDGGTDVAGVLRFGVEDDADTVDANMEESIDEERLLLGRLKNLRVNDGERDFCA